MPLAAEVLPEYPSPYLYRINYNQTGGLMGLRVVDLINPGRESSRELVDIHPANIATAAARLQAIRDVDLPIIQRRRERQERREERERQREIQRRYSEKKRKRAPLSDLTAQLDERGNRGQVRMIRHPSRVIYSSDEEEQNQENHGSGISGSQGYCVKCKQKREMKNLKGITTKNHRKAMQGVCGVCGTKMIKFIK